MSKKVIYNKHLQKGRFYHRGDKSGGHPALIYEKNDKKNYYKTLIFTSTRSSITIKLNESIDKTQPLKRYYVHKYPYVGKRRDFGRKPLTNLRIGKTDKNLIKQLKKWFTDDA